MLSWQLRFIILASIAMLGSAVAKQRFAQLSFTFPNKRIVNQQYRENENTLSIEFATQHQRTFLTAALRRIAYPTCVDKRFKSSVNKS